MSNTRGCFVKSGGPQLNLTNHTDALLSPHLGGVNNGVNSASLCAGVGHCANCPPTSWQVSLLTCSAAFRIAIWTVPPPPGHSCQYATYLPKLNLPCPHAIMPHATRANMPCAYNIQQFQDSGHMRYAYNMLQHTPTTTPTTCAERDPAATAAATGHLT